jgi:gliding motility-associated-like protein
MKFLQYLLLLCCFSLLFKQAGAHGQKDGMDFVANRGQWEGKVRYKVLLPTGLLQLSDSGFEYFLSSGPDLARIAGKMDIALPVDSERIRLHHYKVSLAGANIKVPYRALEQRPHYFNFFQGNDSSLWRGAVPAYGTLIREGVYPGISMKLYCPDGALKYDFNIDPYSDPSLIRLKFEGIRPELQANGDLLLPAFSGDVIEKKPYAYQVIKGRKVTVPCRYVLSGQELSFGFPEGYRQDLPLVIDPELVFVTFSGAGDFSGGYFSFCTTYDRNGNLYAAGNPVRILWSPPPIWPVTPGAFQANWTSIYEPMVCINKYSANGSQLLFSTYYGGAGPNDLPHSMIVNRQGELILAGSTGSFNLPVTPGCFDNTKSGGTDIFIAHFNSTATALIGATYIGGNIGNSVNGIDIFSTFGLTAAHQNKTSPIELALDNQDNIWAVSNTSTIDFPVTSNAFQPTFGGGNCDGVIFALNPACNQMLYSSYIGGSNTDVAYAIQFNPQGKVVVCGGTKSSNFPSTSAAFMPSVPSAGNDWNGFAGILDPQGGLLLHATYLGTEQDDQAVGLQLNAAGEIYVLGRTFGNYPVSNGVFGMNNTDLFIQKLSADLSAALLATRLGNPIGAAAPFFPTGFLVDNCENTYVTGLTGNFQVPLANMPLTPNAFQSQAGNFWFGVLKPDFSGLLFGTYFGRVHNPSQGINGDHTHVGSNHLDPSGILYQSLCVNSNTYPGTTTQSWSQFNQNTVGQDIVSFKFAFNLAGVHAGFELASGQADSGCVPFPLAFNNNSTMATDYSWDFGDGSPLSHDNNPVHTYTQGGQFTVSLYAHNDTACITDDTSRFVITVFAPQVPDIQVSDTLVCAYNTTVQLHVHLNNPSAYNRFRWEPASAIIGSDNDDTVIVNPLLADKFYITVWDTIAGYCGFSVKDSIFLNYKPRVLHINNPDTLICVGASVLLNTTGTAGYNYQWLPATGVQPSSGQNPVLSPLTTTTYTVTSTYPGCADTTDTIQIRVDEKSGISFNADRDSICTGESILFAPTVDTVVLDQLQWQWGDLNGFTTREAESMSRAFDRSGVYPVTLSASFRACPDTTYTDTVYVFALPKVYLGPDSGICLSGQPVYISNLSVPSAEGYVHSNHWSTGDTAGAIKIVAPGIYTLTVSLAPLGCSNTGSVKVTKDCYIDIPNAFTPNGDNVNDYFFPRQLLSKSVSKFNMSVFNRWGEKVFVTENISGRGWDGNFNGRPQPGGVYIYTISVVFDNGRSELYQGNVSLLR